MHSNLAICSLGSKEGPPNGDYLNKLERAVENLDRHRHRADWSKKTFLRNGSMEALQGWRRHEANCLACELSVYAEYTERELRGYCFYQKWRQRYVNQVRPLSMWWYGNKAERAYEAYTREKSAGDYVRWYKAEWRAARARGVVSATATAVRADVNGSKFMTVPVPPHLLRMSRRDEGKLVTS